MGQCASVPDECPGMKVKFGNFKLFYTSALGGPASYISAKLAGLSFDSEVVEISPHTTMVGLDFYCVNPKGNLPTIVLKDGTVLADDVTCLAYISSKAKHESGLYESPTSGTKQYTEFLDKLTYVNAELHESYIPLLIPNNEIQMKEARERAQEKCRYFSDHVLGENKFIFGDKPSVCDVYAYTVMRWSTCTGVNLQENPRALAFLERMSTIPYIEEAHKEIELASS